jgi:hypothetical protein
MQSGKGIFAFMSGPLRSVLASSLILIPLAIAASKPAAAQEPAQVTEGLALAAAPVVPQQVRFTGKLVTRASETVEVEFRIYAAPQEGEPLWT